MDDDGNGFEDDYLGWNTGKGNDDIDDLNFHGTPVAGIIGAQGNNGVGVTGVNWDVKLMIVAARNITDGTFTVAEAVEAYSYALENRKLYNETNGEKGAFVVATNASWGVEEQFPEDNPVFL